MAILLKPSLAVILNKLMSTQFLEENLAPWRKIIQGFPLSKESLHSVEMKKRSTPAIFSVAFSSLKRRVQVRV